MYFNGSDAISTVDLPATYCISAIKKGDNHRTLIDTYCLNDGKHYINYNKSAHPNAANRQSWSGWQLQANNAFSTITVGSTNIAADKADDTLTFVAGSNITLTPDATNDKITISATDTKYEHPTSGVTAGSYRKVTVDANGHVTAGSNPTTIAGYEISDAYTKTETDNLLKDKANTSSLAAVATSGKYTDLTNTPKLSINELDAISPSSRPVGQEFQLNFGDIFPFISEISINRDDSHKLDTYVGNYKLPTEATLSKATVQGSGNAVTDIDVNGHTITLKKEKTFLTAHPSITTQTDSTSTASPEHGGTFTAVDSITRDSNGHVTKINTKTVTLPTITAKDLGIEQVMRFIGSSSTTLTDGATTNPIIIDSKSITAVAGDVVLSNGYEFVWIGAQWEQLGQEGSFSLKTHSHTASYTPAGTVSTPTITVNASDTTINSITDVGTLPSASLTDGGAILTGTISNGPNRTVTLSVNYTAPALTFDAGSLPTKGSNVTVLTGITSATSSQPTFTGTAATITTNAANS